ncbi:MAG: substrate-binding domain-containing protein [Bryobacteraceae bacterium]
MEPRTFLHDVRTAREFSAADLAKRVGVSRQTIYAIEDGSFIPNTVIALRLARVLDVTVEQLFSIEEKQPRIESVKAELLTGNGEFVKDARLVRLCRVNERLIAVPALSVPAYLPAADGSIEARSAHTVSVKPFTDLAENGKRLMLAGCDPALSLVAEPLNASRIEIVCVPCSSRCALEWLKQGRVHAAGSHLVDSASGEYNVPIVKRLLPKGSFRIVTFALWEQGLVLQRGNPKKIRSVADLARKNVSIVNREKGSGSRDLLDENLRRAGIMPGAVAGYEHVVNGHLAAAHRIATQIADCCIANRSAARSFGLDFIPLAVERFDLCFSKASLQLPAAKAFLDLLNRSALRRKLESIAGYDTAHTGELLV